MAGATTHIPRETGLDRGPALFREGYEFIPNRCRRHGSDIFETRIMLQKVVCMSGPRASELFYGGERFTRKRAIPRPTLTLLQDFGSVQGLDGESHRHRKRLFLNLLSEDSLRRLTAAAVREWDAAIERWRRRDEVVLEDEVRDLLCRAVCAWAGVPLSPSSAQRRAADLAALFEGAGSVGPRQIRGQLARRRCEAWTGRLIDDVRGGRLRPPHGSAVDALSHHRGLGGERLSREVAAVELLNLLRPTVAVTRFVTFAALALHRHPEWRRRLSAGDGGDRHRFAQEVRRFYPFFPLVTGRARTAFEGLGHRFEAGDWAMLDVYGTNRDARSWERPESFDPDRFRQRRPTAFDLIPQGGGEHGSGHRCPGEWATIALIETALSRLAGGIDYQVPEQDLSLSLSRMPAVPPSRFRIAPSGG